MDVSSGQIFLSRKKEKKTQIGRVDKNTCPNYMLSRRDSLKIQRHGRTESDRKEKDTLCKQ